MVESTARRERSEPKSASLATYLWEVPQKPVAVRLAFDLIERMEHEVIENFRSLTSRGSEIGGVLLGSLVAGSPLSVMVQDYEAIPCDYTRGPLYRLSDADLGRFERAIEQHSAPGLMVTGFFRAHSRKGLSLDAEDLAFLDARFREPHHIALLVRPFATKTSVGGIFIREDGGFHGEASYLEFPFRSSQLTPSLWTPPEAAPPPPPRPASTPASAPPAAKPAMRSQVVPIGLRRDAGPTAPASDAKSSAPPVADKKPVETKPPVAPAKPPAAEVKTAAPARPAAPEPKPDAKEVKPAAAVAKDAPPAKEAEPVRAVKPVAEKPASGLLSGVAPAESQGSRKIMMVLGGVAATVAALVLLFVYPGFMVHSRHTTAIESPAPELTLRVEPSGTDLLLTWNKNSAAITNASHGVLSINDGDRHENYDMDANQLTTGTIMYTPVSGDVSFRMEVTGKNQTKTLTESVRSLRTRPSPMPDGKSPAANTAPAKTNPAQPQPAATPAGTPAAAQAPNQPSTTPAEVTPTVPAKATPRAFNAESLTQRLRPASPTEIADANLAGAAPASPAGVNVNSSLSMPFASAPAPVAPAPPAAKKAVPTAGGKVAPAQLVFRKEPQYPTAARQMNVKGQVTVEATIGPDGRVTAVKIITGHPLLAQAAKQAVLQWRYKPALLDGQPVETASQISLNFVGTH